MNNYGELAPLLTAWRKADKEEKAARAKKQDIAAAIEAVMDADEVDEIRTAAHVAIRTNTPYSRFDSKRYQAEHPKIAARYMVDGVRHCFTVKASAQ